MSSTKTFVWSTAVVFMATFNLGYVFHDVLLGSWFHAQLPFAREHYIIPYIGLAFAIYALVLAHLFPAYRARHRRGSILRVGLRFGWLMGLVFDGLQGGIIEVATFQMPHSVFLVDSAYHIFVEGSIAGLLLAIVQHRAERHGA